LEERKYRSISLNSDLVNEVEEYIKKDTNYRAIADFVAESVRLRLQQLKREGVTA
jgi:Arc/MetJ-type ribon-helix-helix transcriptional regulator